MHKKMDRKQKIVFFAKLILTVIYIGGLSFAIYKEIYTTGDPPIAFLALSVVFFVFHFFAWISPKKLYGFCWKIYSIFPSEDIGEDYEIYLSKVDNIGLGLLIAAIVFLIIEMLFLF